MSGFTLPRKARGRKKMHEATWVLINTCVTGGEKREQGRRKIASSLVSMSLTDIDERAH
jgi:hypothetical protein